MEEHALRRKFMTPEQLKLDDELSIRQGVAFLMDTRIGGP